MNLGFEQKNKKQLKNTIFENFLTEDKEAESNRLYKLYFVFGLTLGIIFSLLIPIRTVPDETYHIVQSYEVSNIIMGTSSRDGYCMMRNDDRLNYLQTTRYSKQQYLEYWKDIGKPLGDGEMLVFDKPLMKVVKPLYPYFISGLGITIGRLLGLGTLLTFYLGRWLNLIFFVICGEITLRIIPFTKNLMFVILLLPMTIQQGMSYSYDMLVIAISLLSTAMFLKLNYCDLLSQKERITGIIALFILCLLLVPLKSHAYILFILLPIYTLIYSFGGNKKQLIYKASRITLLILVLAVLIFWILAWRIPQIVPEKPGFIAWANEPGFSISVILHNPYRILKEYIFTFLAMGEFHFGTMLVGTSLGSLDVNLPGVYMFCYLAIMFIAAFKSESSSIQLRRSTKELFLFVSVMTVLAIATGMLVSWTPLSYTQIQGIQGRYYLPVVFLILILLNNDRIRVSTKFQNRIPIAVILLDIIETFSILALA